MLTMPIRTRGPDCSQTLALIQRCSSTEELKQIHARMFKTGLVQDDIAASKLLALCTSQNFEYAQRVFVRLHKPNTFMWNAMLRGFSDSDRPEQALLLYQQMLLHSVPHNSYTFPFLLKACSSILMIQETRQIHAHAVKLGYITDVYTANSLIHVYAISGDLQSANLLFDGAPEHDTVSWNAMVNGYAKRGEVETALEFFEKMPEKSVVSWTAMISGYVRSGMNKEALELFQEMQSANVEPDEMAVASVLSACAQLGALEQGKWIHAFIKKRRFKIDSVMGCVLIDMYAKCGDMEEAMSVFKTIQMKSVHAWTAIISGLANHGRGREALDWFKKMLKAGKEPNLVTFTSLLNACSHAGLVCEGKSLFTSMEKNYNLKPTTEHYGCMVNLLGRAGLLDEAMKLIEAMPMKSNAVIWSTLLKSCMIYKENRLGKQIGKILIEMDDRHGGRYIQLANVHAAAGETDQAIKAREMMKERGVSKDRGCSTISMNGTVHEFFAGDASHPEIREILSKWDEVNQRLRGKGYKPVIEDLLVDLDDEEKEVAIHQHSEKLALSFGLIKTKEGNVIRIMKNLRVCKDCHLVMKLVSKIYSREIVMRDRIRFHHFRNGICTCGDYW